MARIRVDTALRFYDEVLGLEHLHYGLWDDEPVTLEGLKSAQSRYAENLVGWIPEGVDRIIDVGCGTGAFSVLLRDRGFAVEGLSPDPRQGDAYAAMTGRPFHLTGFAEFESPRPFDLAVLSESAQYVRPPKDLFASACRNVPGGSLLVADYFVTSEENGPMTKSGHKLGAFLEAGAEQGFTMLREEDITDAVLPTLDLARDFLRERMNPAIRILDEYGALKHPYAHRFARWMLRNKLGKLDELGIMLDAEAFRRAKRYMIYLFRVPVA